MTEAVLLEVRDSVAWITLNRPQAMNAINDQVRELLPACVRAAEADPDVRVIVVRGAGDRAFCAGADVKEFVKVDAPAQYRQSRVHDSWIRPFDEALKPVIASIHGHCLGGGLEIALACDLRIASRDATFGFPETGLGVIPGVGGSQRLLRLAGVGLALDLLLTGERIGAERAHAVGIVSRLVEPDNLAVETVALAQVIAAKPPLATAFAKELIKAGADLPLGAGMRLEVDLLSLLLNTEDRLEAAQAFREKRPARFVGR
jgi:enoyl-CoA hydratase/carnithine racemase